VNWAPLSDVMVAKRALAQSAAVMDESGMASSHLEVRSIMVKGRCGRVRAAAARPGRRGCG
jgi:hypothetical protein